MRTIETWWVLVGSFCLLSLVLFACWAISILRASRKVKKENDETTGKVVDTILESIGWDSKQCWINEDEKEFVSILLGLMPGAHRVWARVRVRKTSVSVIIECWYDLDRVERYWSKNVAKHFKKRGVNVSTQTVNRQPTLSEIYLPEPPIQRNDDTPEIPFGPP